MNGEEEERRLSSDPKVMLMVGAIFISLILLFLPAVFPELGVGGLKYGLDLDGGSWLELKPEGAIVQVDADMGRIIAQDYGVFLNETVTITQQTISSVTFETRQSVTAKGIESLGYGQAAVSGRGGVYIIVLQTDKNTAITKYLENQYKTEVAVFDDEDGIWYEIRKKTSPDELAAIMQQVDGSVVEYQDGVSLATLTETKEILEVKLNLFGLSDVKPVIEGREFILIDLAGIDIDTAMDLAGTPGKFEIRVQIGNNESVHAVYGEDIQTVGYHRMDNNVWGVPFTLTQQGADALRQVAIETNAVGDPDNHEITMYLDNRVIYSAPLSNSLAQSMRVVPIQDLVASFGSDTASKDNARELESLPRHILFRRLLGHYQLPCKS